MEKESSRYTFRFFSDVIKDMEMELDLLNDDAYGLDERLIWEAARFGILSYLLRMFQLQGVAHTPPKKIVEMS